MCKKSADQYVLSRIMDIFSYLQLRLYVYFWQGKGRFVEILRPVSLVARRSRVLFMLIQFQKRVFFTTGLLPPV